MGPSYRGCPKIDNPCLKPSMIKMIVQCSGPVVYGNYNIDPYRFPELQTGLVGLKPKKPRTLNP